MTPDARFGHVNLAAEDWRALAGFYQRVFSCEPAAQDAAASRERAKR